MKRTFAILTTVFTLTVPAIASEAETSASATGGHRSPGSATATARYAGNVGFVRTDTRTGSVNLARGVAVGFDEDGLSVSLSTAIAPRFGPAVGSTFNFSLGANGEAAVSRGTSQADGGHTSAVTVGGETASGPFSPVASSLAGGRTLGGGSVRADTHSEHYGSPRIVHRDVTVVRTKHRVVRTVRPEVPSVRPLIVRR